MLAFPTICKNQNQKGKELKTETSSSSSPREQVASGEDGCEFSQLRDDRPESSAASPSSLRRPNENAA